MLPASLSKDRCQPCLLCPPQLGQVHSKLEPLWFGTFGGQSSGYSSASNYFIQIVTLISKVRTQHFFCGVSLPKMTFLCILTSHQVLAHLQSSKGILIDVRKMVKREKWNPGHTNLTSLPYCFPFENNIVVTHLELKDNSLQAEGTDYLMEMLKENCTIQSLVTFLKLTLNTS